MKIRPIIAVLIMLLSLSACTDSPEKGKARIALFEKCMDLAAKMPRQQDDDVSDIVDSCRAESFYMTDYMR